MTNFLGHHIVLVEDDELSSELLEHYLTAYGYRVTVTPEGEQIEAIISQGGVDALLLDIILPGKDGLHWLEWLSQAHPHIPVLLCSRRTDAEDRVIGLSKGAVDYISKPFHPKEVLLRLRNLRLRNALNSAKSPLFLVGDFRFDAQRALLMPTGANSPDSSPTILTRQEVLLLQLFFEQRGKTVTRDNIATWIYGTDHNPTRRNLDMLINRLRNKLGDTGTMSRYLHTVWGKGYRFTPEG